MEWWEYLEHPLTIITISLIFSGMVSYVVARWVKLSKKHPELPIQFKYWPPWYGVKPELEARLFKHNYLGINQKLNYHILSIRPPNDDDAYYSTKNYEFHFALGNENGYYKFNRLDLDYSAGELNYKHANNLGNDSGPWYPHKATNGDIFKSENIKNGFIVWWVFYFKDNYKEKNHCKCRKYRFTGTEWKKIDNQHNYHYGWGLAADDQACNSCPFKEYISHICKQRNW